MAGGLACCWFLSLSGQVIPKAGPDAGGGGRGAPPSHCYIGMTVPLLPASSCLCRMDVIYFNQAGAKYAQASQLIDANRDQEAVEPLTGALADLDSAFAQLNNDDGTIHVCPDKIRTFRSLRAHTILSMGSIRYRAGEDALQSYMEGMQIFRDIGFEAEDRDMLVLVAARLCEISHQDDHLEMLRAVLEVRGRPHPPHRPTG